MKLCPRDTLLQVTKSFYKRDEVIKARDLLYEKVPYGGNRRVKHKKTDDDLISVYNILQEMETEDPIVFATMNLNNVPYVDLKNIDGVSLMCKQSNMEEQMQNMMQQQMVMQAQLDEITEFIKKSNSVNIARGNGGKSPFNSSHHREANNRRTNYRRDSTPEEQQTIPAAGSTHPAPSTPSHSLEVGIGEVVRQGRFYSEMVSNPPAQTREVACREPAQVTNRISSKYVKDSEGFIRREKISRNMQRPLTMGRKTGTRIKVAPKVNKCKIFVSRLDPEFPLEELHEFVHELTGNASCEIEKLKSRFPTYASYVITCDKCYEKTLLDPDEWEEGVIIRPFYLKRSGNPNDLENEGDSV